MLVLSRKSLERIRIGDSIVVTVLEIRGKEVRFAIDAPKEIHVLRSELQEQVSGASVNGSHATVAPTESFDPRGENPDRGVFRRHRRVPTLADQGDVERVR